MDSLSINNIQQQTSLPESANTISPGDAQNNFANTLKSAIDGVNEAQIASDEKTEALAQGNIDDLHDVMITAQKASLTLETTVQVQGKAIDAYNEIMRMQV
ncbi:flagellar hook-basal body complex protein FliE [Virgibacillus natechei]|uniref:Flagellar hook-basal body complex protein FliE n=1 Tax=Virgibacillus natechei TaxID=1216297 RepID=A0ABS4IBT2_9BACI|nr:flagellar hook-basal body complex protein FliE [Virgibacillus natechei]MBP1968105.1 flagellar hook-basal body complex protein FliE [Virgibacillus natechei]UZD14615.1 flagellar hook-basal body complex protein FliE [Virgibacillus natechei]